MVKEVKVKDEWSKLSIIGFIFSFIIFPVGFVLSLIALNDTKKNPSLRGRGLAITGVVIGGLIGLFFVIGLFSDEESEKTTNQSPFESAVRSTEVFKVNSKLNPDYTNYSFTTATSESLFNNEEFENMTNAFCGSTTNYPQNISLLLTDVGLLMLNPSDGTILCDLVFPKDLKKYEEIIALEERARIAEEINKFPKKASDDKYEVTITGIRKTKEKDGTTTLAIDYQVSDLNCAFFYPSIVDLERRVSFRISGYSSGSLTDELKCSKRTTYEEISRGDIYLKDSEGPFKLVFSRFKFPSEEETMNEVAEGGGEDLYVFDVDLFNLPTRN
jgi:hypothetical protein